ncbi:hypothetical protein DXT91_28075 [Agrobacterium tumefaciens]|uniref:hypothetical protein n=1 Tax=Agrobacterium tumefaciens TaxID=358 RepID=UPI0012B77821|nr:hypothetical protein [Agrobacterium tumefaciens]MQB07902.1 hypothetical protein [Agrobacterium tumefaciens]
MLSQKYCTKILIFLPPLAGTSIAGKLSEHGHESVRVSTVPEAFDALRSDEFLCAITTRPDIDLLRKIHALPVINLEVFFHAGICGDGSTSNSKRFDSKAFLERVDFLARTARVATPDVGADREKASSVKQRRSFPWWTVATSILRLNNRKDTMDVRL